MSRALFWAAFGALVLLRVPSLAQPAGADQGLYAYVGERILHGDVPYRDAWDQKPPGVHVAYAAMFAAWRDERVVAAADLLLAVVTAAALLALGRRLAPGSAGGEIASLLFLFLANPALTRLGGVRVRAQCEVFIAAAVSLALLACWRSVAARDRDRLSTAAALAAGLLIGVAFLFKYNAGIYLLPAALALLLWRDDRGRARPGAPRRGVLLALVLGFLVLPAAMAAYFAAHGALRDLYDATFTYNVRYSGETYHGVQGFLEYLVSFPVRRAWLDSLWWMGGLGCVVLIAASLSRPAVLVVPAWVAAACVSIAVNGSRELPQYFLQAAPALALAAGLALALALRRVGTAGRLAVAVLLAVGVWRVTPLPKLVDYTLYDTRALTGRLSPDEYFARFGGEQDDKYSALAVRRLADFLRQNSAPGDTVLVFGFSQGALVQADRRSASRFAWSRPVLVGFNEGVPGYGAAGLLAELQRTRPRLVVLQRNDWVLEPQDSATYFLAQPALADWLRTGYEPAGGFGNYLFWRRRG